MKIDNQLPWTQPQWQAEAHAWIRAELNRLHIPMRGEIDQFHIYPWSTVMRIPSEQRPVYFKAVAPMLAYEPALTQMLAQRCADHIPQVLALDMERGWMLTADMGAPLRGYLRATKDPAPLLQALPIFAELQIEMIPRADELVALGAPRRAPDEITTGFAVVLADTALLTSSEYALTAQQLERLRALYPRSLQLAEAVNAAGLPLTLHHDDLHDANIFLKDERIIFSDWGDCVVTQPFFSMLILLRSVSDSLEVTEESAEILSLRDAYLRPWAQYTGRSDLATLFEHTWRLGMLNRVVSWYQFLADLEEPYKTRYAYTVPGWLQDFLEIMDS